MSPQINFLEKGHGQPIIFLHGIGGNAESWIYQLEALSASHRAITLDLPGFGHSAMLPELTFPKLAEWLQRFLIEQQLDQPILVGNSFGGMMVQEYLARYPNQAKAVVLTGTSPAFGRKDGAWQQKFIKARLDPLDAGHTMADLAPKIAEGLIGSAATAEALELTRQGVAAVPDETFRAAVMCLVNFDQRDNLSKISVPCLVMVGEEDRNAPASMMEKMAAKIPMAEFHCLPGVGHVAHLEAPTTFNQLLRSFLERLHA